MIGWYVHAHGAGHRTRLAAVAAHLRTPVTGLSSGPAPGGFGGTWVTLPDDLPREAARVPKFLDLPWHDAVTGFHEHARTRGVLATPSAAQVTQPIYRTALARWRRYDFAMNPIARTLAPEIRRYGYDHQEESS